MVVLSRRPALPTPRHRPWVVAEPVWAGVAGWEEVAAPSPPPRGHGGCGAPLSENARHFRSSSLPPRPKRGHRNSARPMPEAGGEPGAADAECDRAPTRFPSPSPGLRRARPHRGRHVRCCAALQAPGHGGTGGDQALQRVGGGQPGKKGEGEGVPAASSRGDWRGDHKGGCGGRREGRSGAHSAARRAAECRRAARPPPRPAARPLPPPRGS